MIKLNGFKYYLILLTGSIAEMRQVFLYHAKIIHQ